MLKTGKYRALRNIPVGWILQAIHSTDRGEMLFRMLFEGIVLLALIWLLWATDTLSLISSLASFFVVHTIFWFLTGNFWVYALDSFKQVRNPGITVILSFVRTASKRFSQTNSVDSVLIYGSMCRKQFHERSDLDLRVVRRRDRMIGLLALPVGFALRAYAFFLLLPVDLQVVDSADFLRTQMRRDETPIVVFEREGRETFRGGIDFDEIVRDPRIVMKGEKSGGL